MDAERGATLTNIVSKERYFETALDALARVGFKGLNIRLMCTALGVTSGSFYHHFGNWQGFVDALFAHWEHRQERILRDLAFGELGPAEDIEALRKLTLGLPHAAEGAIRAWGMNDPSVWEVQHRVNHARRKTVEKAIQRVVGDPKTARVVTSVGMAMLVGYQQLEVSGDDKADLEQMLNEYLQEMVLSRSPQPSAARDTRHPATKTG